MQTITKTIKDTFVNSTGLAIKVERLQADMVAEYCNVGEVIDFIHNNAVVVCELVRSVFTSTTDGKMTHVSCVLTFVTV